MAMSQDDILNIQQEEREQERNLAAIPKTSALGDILSTIGQSDITSRSMIVPDGIVGAEANSPSNQQRNFVTEAFSWLQNYVANTESTPEIRQYRREQEQNREESFLSPIFGSKDALLGLLGGIVNPFLGAAKKGIGPSLPFRSGKGMFDNLEERADELKAGTPELDSDYAEDKKVEQGLGLEAINNPAEIDDYFALADFDMLASLYDLQAFDNGSQTELQFGQERRRPRYYGDLTFSQQGMFEESQNKDFTGEMKPFTGPSGLGLGLMTARFGELHALISEERAMTSPPRVGETTPGYGTDDIGETELIDRRFLAPGEELPEAPLGMEWTLREEDYEYDINTAMANYKSLDDEEQKKFAEGLLSLGYMDGNTDWLLDPDKIYEEDFVREALVAVNAEFSNRKQMQAGGPFGNQDTSITNPNMFPQGDPLLTSFVPQLGLEGGLFDTPDATITDLESYVKEARLKAGTLRTVPTNMIAKQVENWSWQNLGRSADASLQALGLQIAENTVSANLGAASQPSDNELLTAVDQNLLSAVDEDTQELAVDVQKVDANSLLTRWLMSSGRTLTS